MKMEHINKEYITAKDFSLAFGISEKLSKWWLNTACMITMNKYYRYEKNGETVIDRRKPCGVCVGEYEIVYK